jgi:dsDNA-specific endonuclease/ATPase MutS2
MTSVSTKEGIGSIVVTLKERHHPLLEDGVAQDCTWEEQKSVLVHTHETLGAVSTRLTVRLCQMLELPQLYYHSSNKTGMLRV